MAWIQRKPANIFRPSKPEFIVIRKELSTLVKKSNELMMLSKLVDLYIFYKGADFYKPIKYFMEKFNWTFQQVRTAISSIIKKGILVTYRGSNYKGKTCFKLKAEVIPGCVLPGDNHVNKSVELAQMLVENNKHNISNNTHDHDQENKKIIYNHDSMKPRPEPLTQEPKVHRAIRFKPSSTAFSNDFRQNQYQHSHQSPKTPTNVPSKHFDIGHLHQYEEAKRTGVGVADARNRLYDALQYGGR